MKTYGWDLEGSQYYHLPWDLILLLNGEVAVVDVWNRSDTETIKVSRKVGTNPDGTPKFELVDEQVSAVPIFDRLFLGGSNNLRGFDYRDVGPRDVHGEPVGGKSLARGTVELTFPIVEIRSTCLSPSGKKSGHSHISPVSTGFTLSLLLGEPWTSGCRYVHWRRSGELYRRMAPPLWRTPEPRISIH